VQMVEVQHLSPVCVSPESLQRIHY